MVPRLVPEILELDAFCDGAAGVAAGAGAGIGDSRSWIHTTTHEHPTLSLCLLITSVMWETLLNKIVHTTAHEHPTLYLFAF